MAKSVTNACNIYQAKFTNKHTAAKAIIYKEQHKTSNTIHSELIVG